MLLVMDKQLRLDYLQNCEESEYHKSLKSLGTTICDFLNKDRDEHDKMNDLGLEKEKIHNKIKDECLRQHEIYKVKEFESPEDKTRMAV